MHACCVDRAPQSTSIAVATAKLVCPGLLNKYAVLPTPAIFFTCMQTGTSSGKVGPFITDVVQVCKGVRG